MKRYLRGPLEVIYSRLYLAVLEDRSTSEAIKEVVLEGLLDLTSLPSFLPDLYANYDCSLASPNLFERTVKFVCKHSFPVSGVFSNSQTAALHVVAAALTSIETCCSSSSSSSSPAAHNDEGVRESERLQRVKLRKRRYTAAADMFNRDPRKGLEMLKEAGLIHTPRDTAIFLKVGQGLDKRVVGDFVGEREENNQAVLKEYAELFHWAGDSVLEALRGFLEAFMLPGEAQKIERITDNFAKAYYKQDRSEIFNSEDAVHILTFSIIMLNTDQHSPNVKKRMTVEDFIRNVRGTNENKTTKKPEDFPRAYLEAIFKSIGEREIKLKDDGGSPSSAGPMQPSG
eukprot:CAMPEP_0181312764 /NCGR_PEP_ID=MMETSP1101-20121128/13872_1 /TAXON_ID=46948 /ORGANISM="Rhodomonas abbreviata, Strain Caron Lab Isolate" /LENGTH=341 /DNA_ID=CAMNT_0023419639 /DNA_START=27 /DNA_END=1048 /DNA_ORIENTATION=-